jgi:flagellin
MTFKSWDPTNRTANQNITGATAIHADDNNTRTDWAWSFEYALNDLSTPPRAMQKSHSHIQSAAAALNAVNKLDFTIAGALREIGQYSGYIRRLEFASDYAREAATVTDRAHSKIMDADYAKETTELTRTQIVTQAATAMLAQANQAPSMLLQLLK